MHALVHRVEATQATLDRWLGVPFAWGSADCARLTADHVRRMGGRVRIAKAGSYSTALGARRALGRLGVKSLPELIDAHGLLRIAPAAALPGDLLELQSDEATGAVCVVLGNGRVLGWHAAVPEAEVLQPYAVLSAWRVC